MNDHSSKKSLQRGQFVCGGRHWNVLSSKIMNNYEKKIAKHQTPKL